MTGWVVAVIVLWVWAIVATVISVHLRRALHDVNDALRSTRTVLRVTEEARKREVAVRAGAGHSRGSTAGAEDGPNARRDSHSGT